MYVVVLWGEFEFVHPWTDAKCVFLIAICLDLGQCRCRIGSLCCVSELWEDWKGEKAGRVVSVSGGSCNVDVWESSCQIQAWRVVVQEGWGCRNWTKVDVYCPFIVYTFQWTCGLESFLM